MMPKIGLAISTCFLRETDTRRFEIFRHSIQSLLDSSFTGPIYIVDDGSELESHHVFINEFCCKKDMHFIRKSENGGVAKTKNTGIRLLLEAGCDIGFLADDDILYVDSNWYMPYVEAMEKTGIPHFSKYLDFGEAHRKVNGHTIVQTPHVNGCLMTFTRKLIEEVGYFKNLPYKFGHEHSNFTIRCLKMGKIPYYCDVVNSQSLVILMQESLEHRALAMVDLQAMKRNEDIAMSVFQKESLVE